MSLPKKDLAQDAFTANYLNSRLQNKVTITDMKDHESLLNYFNRNGIEINSEDLNDPEKVANAINRRLY